MKYITAIIAAAVLGFCCAADAAYILKQGFEDYDLSFTGNAGDLNSEGGYMTGSLYPHTATPPESNRLANATDTTMISGSNALAMVTGYSGTDFGKRVRFRINTATPFAGDSDNFDLTFWMWHTDDSALVVTLEEDGETGNVPRLLATSSDLVGVGTTNGWSYDANMAIDAWRQFRISVDETDMTYGLSYRDNAGDAWTNIGTDIVYTNARSFNGLNLLPHFGAGAEAYPAETYIDDIQVIPEPASLALLVLAAVTLRRVWSRSKKQA